MGTGISGIYYTSRGSKVVHHGAMIHSFDGEFTANYKTGKLSKLKSGGHGQSCIDLMDKNGLKYKITKTYPNGVRVGYVEDHKDKRKRSGNNQSWFPKNWTQKDMVRAGEHVSKLKSNKHTKDGVPMYGVYKGVRVGVIRTNGHISTIFPDSNQSGLSKKRRKK